MGEQPFQEEVSQAIEPIIETRADIKRENRRFRVYFLYLDGKSQQGIADILEISRDTVISDLNLILLRLSERPPRDMEGIRQDTYNRMVTLRNEALEESRKATFPMHKAKLMDVAAKLDVKILERFTQLGKGKEVRITGDDDLGKNVVDYLREKFGPEQLDDFIAWYERRVKAKSRLNVTAKVE